MDRMRSLLALLLVASTVLFAIGVGLERGSEGAHPATHERGEAPHRGEAEESAAGSADERERVAGTDLESTPMLVLAVALGLALSVIVLTRLGHDRRVLAAIALVMLAWALLDALELVHQLDESKPGIAVLAAVVAVLHLAAAGVSGRMALLAPVAS